MVMTGDYIKSCSVQTQYLSANIVIQESAGISLKSILTNVDNETQIYSF